MNNEAKEKVMWDLSRRRIWCIDKLRLNLEKAQRIATEDLQKLEHKGPEGYYSMNHDILDVTFKIWRASQELGVLKSMEKEITTAFEEMSVPTRGEADLQSQHVDPFELPDEEKTKLVLPPEEADGQIIDDGNRDSEE